MGETRKRQNCGAFPIAAVAPIVLDFIGKLF